MSESQAAAVARYRTRPGSRFPPGATALRDGVNFCVFSRHATRVELLLYAQADSPEPFQVIALSAEVNRTFSFWHVFVEGLPPRTCYTWRADGPPDTRQTGRHFNPRKELLDPWARAVSDSVWDRRKASDPQDAGHSSLRAFVTEPPALARKASAPRGLDEAIIYELHVGGFTRHPSSGVQYPGTFAGLIEKIPYLRELGVTHVELLPVMAFDEQDVPASVAARGLKNFWGYAMHSPHSPHPRYCVEPARAEQEFRALTDAFHEAGIGVLLDVAFNHTAEGGSEGPVINFKGFANDIVYHLDAVDRRGYRDYTGCGNTVNCNHPLVITFIVNCLEYWVEEMGVDGFRFDLASVFARDQRGELMADPPVPWAIEFSRTLSRVPLIAEAWDAAGLYHVGAFPGMAWAEWNGRYRDVVRRFVRGDTGLIGEVASRIAGSADLYAGDGRLPGNSINFITCHDGFTLHDLVSYNAKHNEANGENNRDGTSDNASWNCGIEGETSDPAVAALRLRQAKNCLAMIMLSRGVPMLLAGDEVLRSQRGNNNTWCQDNALSWFDWALIEANRDMLCFTKELLVLRRRHACLTANRFFDGKPIPGRGIPDINWHGVRLNEPAWDDAQGRFLAFTIAGLTGHEEDLHVILNMSEHVVDAAIPLMPARRWHVALDTSRLSPEDILAPEQQKPHRGAFYRANARSVTVLEARG
ncbi:Glycogen operon protein GlgX homolog [Burkholderiales bacterium]|nr:Glycogen operon protein GlgX homolog [Burkholderiales bacterium]